MKTSVMDVRDMLSVLSVDEVEQRIGDVPGVESVTVNFSRASATVRYDETRLEIADIRSGVRQSGFEPTAANAPAAGSSGGGHDGHATPGAPPTALAPAAPKSPPLPDAASATAAPGGDEAPDKSAPTNG